jgi:hypothetical protein
MAAVVDMILVRTVATFSGAAGRLGLLVRAVVVVGVSSMVLPVVVLRMLFLFVIVVVVVHRLPLLLPGQPAEADNCKDLLGSRWFVPCRTHLPRRSR